MTATLVQTNGRARRTASHVTERAIADVTRSLVDSVPEFAMIPKGQLFVDHAYQRLLNEARVAKMATGWSWVACGALKVAMREDGEFWVFDGQHRHAAALRVAAVLALPCLVYELRTVRDEALGFLTQNAARAMTVVDRFRAMVAAGEPTAILLRDLADSSGIVIRAGTQPGHRAMSCANELLGFAKDNPDALRRLWPVLVEMIEARHLVSGALLRGLMFVELSLRDQSLTDHRWRARLAHLQPDVLVESIQRATRLEGRAGSRACAVGILAAVNRGLRGERLVVPSVNE